MNRIPGRNPYRGLLKRYDYVFVYVILLLVLVTLIVSITALAKVSAIKRAVAPEAVQLQTILDQLTVHDEAAQYKDVTPLNIVQVTRNNLGALQQQIAGLDESYVGIVLVQYDDNIIAYDYVNDVVRDVISPPLQNQLQNDFTQRLFAHPETQDLQGQEVEGIQLSQDDIATLFQQNPVQYQDVKEGDFFLQFPSRIVVYDYAEDRIVAVVEQGS